MRFDKKVVILTGAASGMGRSAAVAFAREGAYVFINDVDESRLNSAADEIKSAGGNVTILQGDATRIETVNAVFGKALEKYGRVDILFNYVGGSPGWQAPVLFAESVEEQWDAVIDINLKTTLRFSKKALESMIKQRYGKIINTGSIAGKEGQECMAAYSAAKGGIIAFSKALAREVAQYNINVNCVCPGPIQTQGFKTVFGDRQDLVEALIQPIPLKRLGQPEEVANAVLFLASDEAAYITGQALSVDGGYTMI